MMTREQNALLKKIMETDFVLHETVLYLDGHKNNAKALNFYKKIGEGREKLYKEYNEKYGPIDYTQVRSGKWTWTDGPWPWQNEKEG